MARIQVPSDAGGSSHVPKVAMYPEKVRQYYVCARMAADASGFLVRV